MTYENFYDVSGGTHIPPDENMKALICDKFISALSYAYSAEITEENIGEETEKYVRSIGLTDEEIEKIRANLGADHGDQS